MILRKQNRGNFRIACEFVGLEAQAFLFRILCKPRSTGNKAFSFKTVSFKNSGVSTVFFKKNSLKGNIAQSLENTKRNL